MRMRAWNSRSYSENKQHTLLIMPGGIRLPRWEGPEDLREILVYLGDAWRTRTVQ